MISMARVDMNVISGECPWSETLGIFLFCHFFALNFGSVNWFHCQDIVSYAGTEYYCSLGSKVTAPNVKYPATDIYMLPAGAVLGNYPAYWSDGYQPANVSATIEAIERQIGEKKYITL